MASGYLLDTSIVSILYPGRPEASDAFVAWLRQRQSRTYICTVSIFELTQGVEKLARAGGHARASAYAQWIDSLVVRFGDRLLQLDAASAKTAGVLSDAAAASGQHPGVADIMIAAIAKAHDLVLLTRNVRHFAPLDIAVEEPIAALPR